MKVIVRDVRQLALPLLLILAATVLGACSGMRMAYEAAETLEETAYVVTEHYYVILREANRLADEGAPQEWINRIVAKERQVTPAILRLRAQVDAYNAVRNAETEQELSDALSEAVVLVSEFIDVVRGQ